MSERWTIKVVLDRALPENNDASPEEVVAAIDFVLHLYDDWTIEPSQSSWSMYRWDHGLRRYMTWLAYRHQ